MNKIFITHCSCKKDPEFEGTNIKVTPDKLYRSRNFLGFIDKCESENENWAVFSDKFGIVFPTDKIPWYNKSPNAVTEDEYKKLLADFISKLIGYQEIWFYHNPGRFHSLYRRIVKDAKEEGLNIILFSHKNEISRI